MTTQSTLFALLQSTKLVATSLKVSCLSTVLVLFTGYLLKSLSPNNWHEHEIITCWAIGFLSSILLLIGSIFKKPLLYVLWIVYTFFVFFFFPLVLSLIALVGLMTSDAKLPEYTINKDSVNGEGLLAVVVVCSIYFCGVFYLMYVVSRECYVLSIQEGKRHFPDSKENSSIEEEVKKMNRKVKKPWCHFDPNRCLCGVTVKTATQIVALLHICSDLFGILPAIQLIASLSKQSWGYAIILFMVKQIIFNSAIDALLFVGSRNRQFEYYVPFILNQALEFLFIIGMTLFSLYGAVFKMDDPYFSARKPSIALSIILVLLILLVYRAYQLSIVVRDYLNMKREYIDKIGQLVEEIGEIASEEKSAIKDFV
ncbi:hypothetical protein M3Y97_00163800 [Aphelenchoides bicaudatus]|nr:hypothetical protein M3Y97_00163800 [Aphelenchoides bicaudatus]